MNGHKCDGNVCTQCGKKYADVLCLKRHVKEKHTDGANRVSCAVCNKSYAAKRYLAVHLKSAHGDTAYVCNVCGDQFRWEASMIKHVRNKHPQPK